MAIILNLSLNHPVERKKLNKKELAVDPGCTTPEDFSSVNVTTETLFWQDIAHVGYFVGLNQISFEQSEYWWVTPEIPSQL